LAHGIIRKIAKNSSIQTKVRNEEEGKSIIERLFQCDEHTFAPSGKLIVSTITLEEISNKF
jgi:hypothetical protein